MTPCIAIIDTNTLSLMALRGILLDIFPDVEVLAYGSFEEFQSDSTRFFVHYFVSDDIVFAHAGVFGCRRKETIVTSKGPCQTLSATGFKVLNVSLPEAELMCELFKLHNRGHHSEIPSMPAEAKTVKDVLSDREKSVLSLIVAGKLNKEIADELSISQATVAFHRNNICSKLGTRSIGRLTIYAVLSGIIDIKDI